MLSDELFEAERLFEPGVDRLAIWLCRFTNAAEFMPHKHRHTSVELNFICEGAVSYLWADRIIELPPRRSIVFWGAIPHQIVSTKSSALLYSLHVPMAWFLEWQMPPELVGHMLHGEIIIENSDDWGACDQAFFDRWNDDLSARPVRNAEVAMLEIRARLNRLALGFGSGLEEPPARQRGKAAPDLTKVEQMASFVARHYTEEITLEDIAGDVGLHPKYATQLFHRKCGFTLKQYITMNRIHHAQLLLLTTDAKILDIALHSGFGSVSRFYGTFNKWCGKHPTEYREAMRNGML